LRRLVSCIIGGIILLLLATFADPAIFQFREYSWTASNLSFALLCLLPIVAFTSAAGWHILRGGDDRSITRLAMLVLLLSFLARMAWVLTFDSYQTNDFGSYLACAEDVAISGDPAQSLNCHNADNVYWRRAAFYTYPLVLLFGPSLPALKIVNVCLATLTGLFFYLAGKKIFSTRVAAAGLLFFIWHPDLWYAMTLASHDVPGMFWLSLFFYCSVLLRRRLLDSPRSLAAHLGFSVLTGIVVFLVGMTRSYQYGAIAGLGGCALIHAALLMFAKNRNANEVVRSIPGPDAPGIWVRARTALVHITCLLVIPFLTYSAGMRIFLAIWQSSPLQDRSGGIICYITSMNVFGENRFDEIDSWMNECADIPENDRGGFAVRKILHDMSHDPGMFLLHLVRKNRVLSRADDYLFWAGVAEHEPSDRNFHQVKRINSSRLSEQSMALYLARIGLLFFIGWRLLLYPRIGFQLSEAIPIIFSVVYFGMFLIFLESQARYEIFLMFVFSWMAGQSAVSMYDRFRMRVSPSSTVMPGRKLVYGGGALFLAVVVGLFWGAASAIADSSLTLRDQSGFKPFRPARDSGFAEGPQISPVFVANNHKQLILAYPTGAELQARSTVAVQRTFEIRPSSRHYLRFFLSTASVRNGSFVDRIPWDDQKIEYVVLANGFPVDQGTLQAIGGDRLVSAFPGGGLAFGRSLTLQLILRNNSRIERVGPDRGPVIALEYVDLR
jgi:hypothetical protein